MTTPVLAPPPVLYDTDNRMWVYSGDSDAGPVYLPMQAPMPLPDPAPAELPWATVTVTGKAN